MKRLWPILLPVPRSLTYLPDGNVRHENVYRSGLSLYELLQLKFVAVTVELITCPEDGL